MIVISHFLSVECQSVQISRMGCFSVCMHVHRDCVTLVLHMQQGRRFCCSSYSTQRELPHFYYINSSCFEGNYQNAKRICSQDLWRIMSINAIQSNVTTVIIMFSIILSIFQHYRSVKFKSMTMPIKQSVKHLALLHYHLVRVSIVQQLTAIYHVFRFTL